MKPCFINTSTPDAYDSQQQNLETGLIELGVDDCTCKIEQNVRGNIRVLRYRCNLPACAVRAFKGLQTQQVAHANSIAQLESAVMQLQAPPAPSPPESLAVPMFQPTTSESIQEEVRKWLDRCRVEVEFK